MNEPLGSYKAGELISHIKTLMREYTDVRFPKKSILNELNFQILEMQSMFGNKDDTRYTGYFAITNTDDTIDLTQTRDLIHYKNYDKIIYITYQSGIPCIERDEKDFYSIKAQGANSQWKDSVIWTKKGTVIYFYKGTGVTSAYGTRTIWFTRIPTKLTNYEDYVDIHDSDINTLRNRVMKSLLQAKGLDPNLITDASAVLKQTDAEERVQNRIYN